MTCLANLNYRPILICIFLFLFSGCASTQVAPLAHDTRMSSLEKDEVFLWKTANDIEKQIDEDSKSFEGKDKAKLYLAEVMQKISTNFNNPEMSTRLYLLVNPIPNAFVLPNGATYVTSGLLSLLENEAQLATVLGHEFYHFKNRHSLRQKRKGENEAITGLAVGIIVAGLSGAATGSADTRLVYSVSDLWKISSISGYSRELEMEADELGFIAVLKAGYSPEEPTRALKLLGEFTDEYGQKTPTFFSTHPKPGVRIHNFSQLLRDSTTQEYISGKIVAAKRYNDVMLPVILENASLNIKIRKMEIAQRNIDRCLVSSPNCSKAHFLLGELIRNKSVNDNEAMEKALNSYKKSLELDPDYAASYREIGLLYKYMDNSERARKYLLSYLELAPDAIDAPLISSYLNSLNSMGAIK